MISVTQTESELQIPYKLRENSENPVKTWSKFCENSESRAVKLSNSTNENPKIHGISWK